MSDVVLPQLGESVTEGTVTRWLKAVGDTIAVDEPLVEISTDKVDTEIPSPVAGVLEEILVAEDETIEVGAVLARVGDGSGGGEAPAAPAAEPAQAAPAEAAPAEPAPAEPAPAAPAQAEPAPAAPAQAEPAPAAPAPAEPTPADSAPAAPAPTAPTEPAPAAAPAAPAAPAAQPAATESTPAMESGASGYLTPIVRKLAIDLGVDVSTVTGTGVGGRITKDDITAAAERSGGAAPAAPAPLEISPLRGTTAPLSRLRKVIAERAVVSMNSTAQLTSVVEVDLTKVAEYRDQVKADFLAKTGHKLSFLPFFAVATTEALAQYPVINSTVDGDSIVYPPAEHISIAVDTPRGLLSPVIRDGLGKTIAQWAADIADLAERTRNNQLKPDELAGGTFTLTNTGSRGALFDTPVVFLPQSAILGTGVVTKRPAVVEVDGREAIGIRSFVYLALSYDHRIIDGADAARFLGAVKARLEAGDFAADLGI